MGKSRLVSKLRTEMRRRGYDYKTEQTYTAWVKNYVQFQGLRHPKNMSEPEVRNYLNYLAEEQLVSASIQNQALSALLFLYTHVLQQPLQEIKKPLSADEKEARP